MFSKDKQIGLYYKSSYLHLALICPTLQTQYGKAIAGNFTDSKSWTLCENLGKGCAWKKLDIQSKKTTWLDILSAVGTVIVCSELGEAVSAAKGNTPKDSTCNKLPQNHDYFAVTFSCLKKLVEQNGLNLRNCSDHIKIADKAVWKLTADPFIPCPHEENSSHTCWERPGLIQKAARPRLFDRLTSQHLPGTRSTQQVPANGAAVFG